MRDRNEESGIGRTRPDSRILSAGAMMEYCRLASSIICARKPFFLPCGLPLLLALLIGGCASTQDSTPIVDRSTEEPQTTIDKPEPAAETTVQQPKTYVVQKGDTLYAIALSNGISQKDLA